jgi:hypothetical protein
MSDHECEIGVLRDVGTGQRYCWKCGTPMDEPHVTELKNRARDLYLEGLRIAEHQNAQHPNAFAIQYARANL